MHRNKGFSLIELVVVIAILGIAAGLVVGSLNVVHVQNMRSCASEIDALLSKTKICAMSRAGNVYLVLRQTSDGVYADYYEGGVLRQTDKVGKSTVIVVWNDGTEHDLGDGPLCLTFDRGTGAFEPLSVSFGYAGLTYGGGGDYCDSVTVSSGGRSTRIELTPVTGKHLVTAG